MVGSPAPSVTKSGKFWTRRAVELKRNAPLMFGRNGTALFRSRKSAPRIIEWRPFVSEKVSESCATRTSRPCGVAAGGPRAWQGGVNGARDVEQAMGIERA